jgi:hypothetical protein
MNIATYDLYEMRLRFNEIEAEFHLENNEERAYEISPMKFDRVDWMAQYDALGA